MPQAGVKIPKACINIEDCILLQNLDSLEIHCRWLQPTVQRVLVGICNPDSLSKDF